MQFPFPIDVYVQHVHPAIKDRWGNEAEKPQFPRAS
jgi:hypothetical protein